MWLKPNSCSYLNEYGSLMFFMRVFLKCFYNSEKTWFFMFFICKLMFLTSMFKTEEASTRESAKDQRRQCFCDSWRWPFDPEINGYPGLTLKHLCVKFGDHGCIGFWDIVQKKTDRQTNGGKTVPPRQPSAWIIKLATLINFSFSSTIGILFTCPW